MNAAAALTESQRQRRRHWQRKREGALTALFALAASLAVLVTLGMVMTLFSGAVGFLQRVGLVDYLFGLVWQPQIGMRADQGLVEGQFGLLPLLSGSLLITVLALLLAVPIGLGAAIFLAEYATPRQRNRLKPLLELLAGIPTVVYGFFAALVVAPLLHYLGGQLGIAVSAESALACGLVVGVMIIPFVASMADDALYAVPQAWRDAAIALGATHAEMIRRTVLPAAFPGLVSACLIGFSKAIGQTMIVLMAGSLTANLTFNPLDGVSSMTAQIITLLSGDQEFASAATLSAFALALTLLILALLTNTVGVSMNQRWRQRHGQN
jgi:phosphate transport system permease protein